MNFSSTKLVNQSVKAAIAIVAMAIFSSVSLAEKINLNTADVETIQYIPGIGPSKATKLVEVRTQNGGFSSMEEIDAIKGFGERTMIDVKKHGSLDSGVSELTPEMQDNRPARSVSGLKKTAMENAS